MAEHNHNHTHQREKYRQFSIIAYVVMLALLVPLTVFVVQKEQSVRSQASNATKLAGDDSKEKSDTSAPSDSSGGGVDPATGTTDPNFQTLGPCNDPAQCPNPSITQISGGPVMPNTTINQPVDGNNAPVDQPCEDDGDGGGDEEGEEDEDGDKDKGHGNDEDGVDEDNPGQGVGGPNADKDQEEDEENEEDEPQDGAAVTVSGTPNTMTSAVPERTSIAKDSDDDSKGEKGKGKKSNKDDDDEDSDEDEDEDDEKDSKHWDKDGVVSGLGGELKELLTKLINLLMQILGGGQINIPDGDDEGDEDNEEGDGGGDDEDNEDDEEGDPCPPPADDANNGGNGGGNPIDNPVDNPMTVPSGAVPSQAAAPSLAPAPSGIQAEVPVGSRVIFDGSFDKGGLTAYSNCQWNGNNGNCPAQGTKPMAEIVNDGAGHETAARFEIQPGHMAAEGNRTEARAPNSADVKEGDERWYQFSLKFDQNFKNPAGGWFIVMQWHAGSGSPPLALEVNKSGELEFTSSVGNKRVKLGPIKKGQWVNYVVHAKFSGNASTGFVEAWENGQQKVQKTSMATMSSSSNYLKLGIYRDDKDTGNNVVFHDGLKIIAP